MGRMEKIEKKHKGGSPRACATGREAVWYKMADREEQFSKSAVLDTFDHKLPP